MDMDMDMDMDMESLISSMTGLVIQRRPTVDEAFGENNLLPPQGRDLQMDAILKEIRSTTPASNRSNIKSKCGSIFFHASPGVGKTFLLSQLFRLSEYDIHFFVCDFNRNSCKDAVPHKKHFLSDPELFILFRLYYIEFVDQTKLTWIGFLNTTLEKLSTATKKEDFKSYIRRHLEERVKSSGCNISVILVDEILKTQQMSDLEGIEFSNLCRSYLCQMADANKDICNLVIFSSLEVPFMLNERTSSGRPMRAVCTLPLLTFQETFNILTESIQCNFCNEENISVSRDQYIEQLADVCGGHPRSIEYVISVCNNIIDEADRKNLYEIITDASSRLIGAYEPVENYDILLKAILLNEEVVAHDIIGNETYESLVNRGILLNSLGDEDINSSKFIPMCPELFLHAWTHSTYHSSLSTKMRLLLRQILKLRGHFTRIKFENLHCYWEQLIRMVRPDQYKNIALRDVYCIKSRVYNDPMRASENAASCPVNACEELVLNEYKKGDVVEVQLNTILSPSDDRNAGWDRLIFYEAFPSGQAKRNRFTLPVFIQNKYSSDGATTKLTIDQVNKATAHCQRFLEEKCKFKNCALIPKKTKWYRFGSSQKQFVLIFIVKQGTYQNTTTDAPSNVIFCFEEDLHILYGKTLAGFVKYLVPDSTIYATPY